MHRLRNYILCVVVTILLFFAVTAAQGSLFAKYYVLNTNTYVEVIEEKDIDRNRKSPDDYEFKLTVDGESFWLEVDAIEYDDYEIGDVYEFKQHSGAFGVRFYVSE